MKLEEYHNLKEITKRMNIAVERVETEESFDKMTEYLKKLQINNKTNPYLFRGVSEAKYKVYSSAQRKWIENDLSKSPYSFHDMVFQEVDNLREERHGLLQSYYSSLGIKHPPYFLYLSFLQHYGAPTTLIDVTYDFKKALFFCFDKMKRSAKTSGIKGYVALYVFNNNMPSLKCKVQDAKKMNYVGESTNGIIDELAKEKLLVIHGPKYKGKPLFLPASMITNLNMTAQEGAFIYYLDADRPLEEQYNKYFYKCYYIHKRLKDYILSYLKDNDITSSTMYPQEEGLAKEASKNLFTK